MKIVIEGEPASKERPRFGRGHFYTPRETKKAEEYIGWKLKESGIVSRETDMSITLIFHTENRKKDLDNMIKLVLDACNGIAWKDDRQVKEIWAKIEHNSPPHTEILIKEK